MIHCKICGSMCFQPICDQCQNHKQKIDKEYELSDDSNEYNENPYHEKEIVSLTRLRDQCNVLKDMVLCLGMVMETDFKKYHGEPHQTLVLDIVKRIEEIELSLQNL